MFNQFHSTGCLTLLVVAMVLASCAASAAAIEPNQLPRAEPAFSAQTSIGTSALKTPEQPRQWNPRPNAATDSRDADAGESTTSTNPSGISTTMQSAPGDAGEPVPQRLVNNVSETISAPGRALFARSQDLDVTQPVSVSQILVLEQPIGPGTRLKIMAFNALGSWYQTTDPDGPNHVALTYPETGAWTAVIAESARGLQRSLIFELTSGSFEAGQTLEIRYSRLQGAKALEDPLTLPVAMQLPNAPSWQVLPGEARSFVSGPAIALQISVDQQVQISEPFDLSIQPIDALGNAAEITIESFDLLLNNRLLKEVNLQDGHYVATGLTLKTLGRHQFSARSPAGGLQSKMATVWALPESPPQLIWTDFSERSLGALIATLPTSAQDTQNPASSLLDTALEPQSPSVQGLQTAQVSSRPLMPDLIGSGNPVRASLAVDQAALAKPAPMPKPFDPALTPIDSRLAAPSSTFAPQTSTKAMTQAVPLDNTSLEPVARAEGAPSIAARFPAPATAVTLDQESEDMGAANNQGLSDTSAQRINIGPLNIGPLNEGNTAIENFSVNDPRGAIAARSETAYTRIQTKSPEPAENGLSALIQPIEAGGQSLTLVVDDTTLRIAQPELTTDRRGRQVDLVEQFSGPSGHQWLSHYFATLGQTFGITSRKTSFQPRAHQQGPQTAIAVRPGQTWLEALARGQTFVTSGTQAGLSFSINGTQFGRAPHQAQRTADIAVTSSERPLWARIFRNGELLAQLPFTSAYDLTAATEGLERRKQGHLFLYLESDSKPFAPGVTTPRNGREWLGQLRLQDLTITDSRADHLAALSGHQLSQSPDQQQLDFLTWTHGTGALMQFDVTQKQTTTTPQTPRRDPAIDTEGQTLDEPGETRPSPVITLELAEGYEDLTYFDASRPPAATPSFNEQFDLEALRGQGIRRTLSVDGYLDQISLWYVDAEPDLPIEATPPTHQITYLDRMGGRPGDYYTCQVLLRDGTSLYSSPIFVGGFDPRS